MDAERAPGVVFADTLKPTVPLPVPAAPLVTVTKVASVLTAVQAQVVVLAWIVNVLDAPAESVW